MNCDSGIYMKKLRILLLGLLFISISLNAQVDYTTKSKSAIRHYENARNQFGLLDYDKAIDFLNSAIKSDKRFYEAHQFQGYIYFMVEQYENAIGSYKKGSRFL